MAATQEEIDLKHYKLAKDKKMQLDDVDRIKQFDRCAHEQWILFSGHPDEAMRFLKNSYRDYFGAPKETEFSKIAIVSCAPDLTNYLVSTHKRFEELTSAYIPPKFRDVNDIRNDGWVEAGAEYLKIPTDALNELLQTYGYDVSVDRIFYQLPAQLLNSKMKETLKVMKQKAKESQNNVVIHVRCSPDILGLELMGIMPRGIVTLNDAVNYAEANNMFKDLECGKTYLIPER